jgi:uncharacterized protein (DUF1810 family)
MSDRHDLQRFLDAQDSAGTYERVVAELGEGRKRTHWMWFVFPQLAGLGQSPTARRYAIASLEQAHAYTRHPVLGARLRECTLLVLAASGTSEAIFGPVDSVKLRSSMTLFTRADPAEPVFLGALDRFYRGVTDPLTDALLSHGTESYG